MFKINRLRLEINAKNGNQQLFGFDIPFNSGLNIISGKNSSGKSTIVSCIYYSLGMEQLIGGRKNENAMDKAVKERFLINDKENDVESGKHYEVNFSKIYLEISNSEEQIVTLLRYINPGNAEGSSNSPDTKVIKVYESPFQEKFEKVNTFNLFLNSAHDHEGEVGFYNWLANFIGIELPIVNNNSRSDGNSPLFLQTIFPALFIEQTKGWSDYLATIPYFGIPSNKEKTIEFLLDLKQLKISTEQEKIKIEEKHLKEQWKNIINKLQLITSEYDGKIISIPEEISADKKLIEEGSIKIKNRFIADENVTYYFVDELKKDYQNSINELREKPIKKISEAKPELRANLELIKKEYTEIKERYNKFEVDLTLQKYQLKTLNEQMSNLTNEISSSEDIQKVFEESLIDNLIDTCPTCHQGLSSLENKDNMDIHKSNIQENLVYLKNQRKIVESSIKSLIKIIEEKEIIDKYFNHKLINVENQIKVNLNDLVSDERDFSELDTLSRVRLEKETFDLEIIESRFNEQKSDLIQLAEKYHQLIEAKNTINSDLSEDKDKLDQFEKKFKGYLRGYEYLSNPLYHTFIQKANHSKYFPVIKNSEDDKYPQSIQINSSASDFIRTIWAYSVSLLEQGINHPGLLLLDEPGQHSVSNSSLKSLFESVAKIKNKQIIIATSEERNLGNKEQLNLDLILNKLKINKDYSLYRIPFGFKSITKLS